MDCAHAATILELQADALAALCRPLPVELLHWRPANGGWTVHEVLCHLLDEERDDFRVRLRSTLEDPQLPWPPIDPEGWVALRNYAARNRLETLDAFLAERHASLEWLRSLNGAGLRWDNAYQDPRGFAIRARDLLAAWLDHDRLHLRQILRLLHQSSEQIVPRGSTEYAGQW